MDPAYIGLMGFVLMLIMITLGSPVGFALGLPGILGLFWITGIPGTFEILISQTFRFATKYEFTAVPLFLTMGYMATYAGVTKSAYDSARIWLAGLPGGLSMATAVASGFLGACMGSGIPAAAAMGRVAIPEMLRHNYDKGLAAGSVAAAATVAVLIPPSIPMVIYAIFTEASLGNMLLAGYLPGILSIMFYVVVIGLRVHLNPKLAPSTIGETITWKQRLEALKGLWGIGALFAVLLVGIYSGFFTPTEAAAAGAFAAFVIMVVTKHFSWESLRSSMVGTLEVCAMLFMLLIGASIFVVFITVSGLPKMMASWIVAANLSPLAFVIVICILFLFLGCFMDAISMLLLTIPVFLPVLVSLDIDLIWFGIIYIKMAEIGGMTPPFGISVYVVKGVVGDEIPLSTIFRGIWWFVITEFVIVAILIAFPQISLWLPMTMKRG